jgi:anti-repressor protein
MAAGAERGMTMATDLAQAAFQGRAVRWLADPDGTVWFVASDVASILGYRMASDMTRRVDEDDKGMRNDSPLAKPFRRWVTTEVLPSIRETGAYGAPATEEPVLANAMVGGA